jgi:hypothetical protein
VVEHLPSMSKALDSITAKKIFFNIFKNESKQIHRQNFQNGLQRKARDICAVSSIFESIPHNNQTFFSNYVDFV